MIDRIRQAYWQEPFRPFLLHLADGRNVPVNHREWIAISPTERQVLVLDSAGASRFVDVAEVRDLSPFAGSSPDC